MFRRFRYRPDGDGGIASALYGAIVAQARTPALYSVLSVPDTVDGRFEMLALHLFLVLGRLEQGDKGQQEAGQRVFDLFCADMDRSLRELGVGDLSVPKRVRRMAAGYYGRAAAYRAAIQADDRTGLAEGLARNVFAGVERPPQARGLADYCLAAQDRLAQSALPDILAGEVAFPDPASFLHETAKP
jgi:cytochrome b pre-mRNA-processing protein 3